MRSHRSNPSVASPRVDSAVETTFPFVIEKGAPDNITNVQTWNDGAHPYSVGFGEFLRAERGELLNGTKKTRLLGTNLCFSANFPSREKAERLAATLARFGIGAVRLHHMDRRDIWGKNFAKGKTEIDPDQLDKLDYLIYQLYKRGIYVNINLHVSRKYAENDGFQNVSALPYLGNGVDNFNRRMIELQKKYAKDLLTHVNPYTGKAYVDDPGVAMIEINNESSVVASWSWGDLDKLPEPYAGEFRELWNEWLRKKYKTTDALRKAWNSRVVPFGEEQNKVGDFDQNFRFDAVDNWNLVFGGDSKATWRVLTPKESGLDGGALQISVHKSDKFTRLPQLICAGLRVKKGAPYRLRFKIRANKVRFFRVGVVQAREPQKSVGYRDSVAATPEWREVEAAFVATTDDDQVRLTFNWFEPGDVIELADVSFREGGCVGLSADASLEEGSVPVPMGRGGGKTTRAIVPDDFTEFLHDVENDYWQEMYGYVKDLGAKSIATGTQLQYGFWHNQARLDYCDIHGYWNHPDFPKSVWKYDFNDWLVKNRRLADEPINGELADMATLRVIGKPYSCSEYCHPYPNSYAVEGVLMLSAFAAFQDWSAFFQFAWSHDDDFERRMATPFFDMSAIQTKMAHLPACYAIFVRGDVQSGPDKFIYATKLTEQGEIDAMKGSLYGYYRPMVHSMGLDESLSLAIYAGLELPDLDLKTSDSVAAARRVSNWDDLPAELGSPEKRVIVNEFNEIKWDFRKPNQGRFVVDTARCKVFSGSASEPYAFDAVKLEIGETILDWATVSLVKAKGVSGLEKKDGTLSCGSYLLVATGDMRNTDAVLKTVGENSITTSSVYGGSDGREPTRCEGVPATITLFGVRDVQVYALDESGDRVKEVPVEKETDPVFTIGPEYIGQFGTKSS